MTAKKAAIFCFLLSAFCLLPSGAQAPPPARPRVLLVLCDALRWEDIFAKTPEGAYAYIHLVDFAQTGAVGLMNVAVAGPKTEIAATLTLATGQQTPAEPTDAQAANDWEGVAGERGGARAIYLRRYGPLELAAQPQAFDPHASVKHLGIAGLVRRGLDTDRLGAALAHAAPPVRTFVCGNADTDMPDRSGALLTVDAAGVGAGMLAYWRFQSDSPFGIIDAPLELTQYALEADADFTVIQAGDTARAEAARARLSEADYRQARAAALSRLDILVSALTAKFRQEGAPADILLVASRPPAEDAYYPVPWMRLTPVLASGPDFPPGLLTSATTRTPGLLANVDLAPTLLDLFHLPVPATMVGRPFHSTASPGQDPVATVSRLDYISSLNEQAKVWVILPLCTICLLIVLSGFLVHLRRGVTLSRWFAPGILLMLNLPAALLLAPILVPPTLLEYGLRILAWMIALTVVCYVLAPRLRLSPPVVAALLGVTLLAVDTLIGQPLQKDSLLGSYAIGGIRYYGVGNEYLGVILGLALVGGFAWLDDRGIASPPQRSERLLRGALGLAWLALLGVLGWPGLGANAGSLASTGAGFGVGIALLLGRRPTLRLGIACLLAGLGLSFLFAWLDSRYAGAGSSHAGTALQAASRGRGAGYLAQIAARKVAMNLHLLASPPFWLLAGTVVTLFLVARRFVGPAMRDLLQRRPWTDRGRAALLAAGCAALIFKDSGVVTVVALIASASAFVLYYVVAGPTRVRIVAEKRGSNQGEEDR
jgi:hypothetical protein